MARDFLDPQYKFPGQTIAGAGWQMTISLDSLDHMNLKTLHLIRLQVLGACLFRIAVNESLWHTWKTNRAKANLDNMVQGAGVKSTQVV